MLIDVEAVIKANPWLFDLIPGDSSEKAARARKFVSVTPNKEQQPVITVKFMTPRVVSASDGTFSTTDLKDLLERTTKLVVGAAGAASSPGGAIVNGLQLGAEAADAAEQLRKIINQVAADPLAPPETLEYVVPVLTKAGGSTYAMSTEITYIVIISHDGSATWAELRDMRETRPVGHIATAPNKEFQYTPKNVATGVVNLSLADLPGTGGVLSTAAKLTLLASTYAATGPASTTAW